MSVTAPNTNPLASTLRTVGRPLQGPGAGGAQPAGIQPGAARPTAAPAQPAALRPQQPLAAPQQALPAEPPAGTDPALWSVLTSDERTYFAKASAMGPLTYGRIASGISTMRGGAPAPTGAMLGGRLDVRA